QRLGLHLEEGPPVGLEGGDTLGGHQPVRSGVLSLGEQIGVRELRHLAHSSLGITRGWIPQQRRLASVGSANQRKTCPRRRACEVRLSSPRPGREKVAHRGSRDLSRFGTLSPWTFTSTPQRRTRHRAPPHRASPSCAPRTPTATASPT
ncbi:hypothetical protein B5181_40015, partial [Streptomyces sp. 4F]